MGYTFQENKWTISLIGSYFSISMAYIGEDANGLGCWLGILRLCTNVD